MRVFTGVLKIIHAESMTYKNNQLNSAHLIIRGNLGNTVHAQNVKYEPKKMRWNLVYSLGMACPLAI